MIIKDSRICGSDPTIKGTMIPVTLILYNIRDGVSFEEICQDYHITVKDIRECIEYAIKKIQ